jgi:hypothetical protein
MKKKKKNILKNKSAGSLIEKALLIGFAIFIFFLVVHVVTEILDILTAQTLNIHDFFFGS